MKKLIMMALCALGLSVAANAQETFRRGDAVLNLGIGVHKNSGVKLPPLSLTYETSVADGIGPGGSIGLGGQVEIGSAVKGFGLFAGPRAAFHYEFVDNLDVYAGLQAGLGIEDSSVNFDWAFITGARYYFSEGFGAFAELGTGMSVFKLGATFRL